MGNIFTYFYSGYEEPEITTHNDTDPLITELEVVFQDPIDDDKNIPTSPVRLIT